MGHEEPAARRERRHVRLLPGPLRAASSTRRRLRRQAEPRTEGASRSAAPLRRPARSPRLRPHSHPPLQGLSGDLHPAGAHLRSRSCSGSSSSCSSSDRLLPGEPCHACSASGPPTPLRRLQPRPGFDQPIPVQFVDYLGKPQPRATSGSSFKTSRPGHDAPDPAPADDDRADLLALLFATIVGVLLGIISAVRRNSAVDVVHDGRRQHRRLDPGLRARPRCSPTSSRSCSRARPSRCRRPGRLSPGISVDPARDALGPEGCSGPLAGDPRLRLEHLHAQRADHAASGRIFVRRGSGT